MHATIVFAVQSRDAHAIFLSVVLTGIWAASNIGWQLDALDMYPIMDAAVACYALVLALRKPVVWTAVFLQTAIAQLLLHVAYAALGTGFVLPYLLLLDVTFAIELLCVSWEGITDVGIALSDRLWGVRVVRAGNRSRHSPKEIAHVD